MKAERALRCEKWTALLNSGGYIVVANTCCIDALPQAFNI